MCLKKCIIIYSLRKKAQFLWGEGFREGYTEQVYLTEQVGFRWIERRLPVFSGELLGSAVLFEFTMHPV